MHIRAEGSVECPACNAIVPDTSQFCPQCGNPLTDDAMARVQYRTPRWAFLVLILFLGLAAYVAIHAYLNRQPPSTAVTAHIESPAPQAIPLKPPSRPQAVAITNGALAVKAGTYAYYSFTVPAGASAVTVSGHFTAAGGTGNDIQVYILDEDGLANFKNQHSSRTFYNSGKVTQATIAATLPNSSATYYLLFDNRDSPEAPKAIQVNATLNYTQ